MANIMYPATLALATVSSQGLTVPITTSNRKTQKLCRLTKWLLSAQAKLRTLTNKPAKITTEKPCYPISSKSTQQRRIHNEIFGWTSDAFDDMSMGSPSSSNTGLTSSSPSPSSSKTGLASSSPSPSSSKTGLASSSPSPSSSDTRTREQLLRDADDAMIAQLESTFTQDTGRRLIGRGTYLRIDGYC